MHTEAPGLQLQLQLQEDCKLLMEKPELGMYEKWACVQQDA